MILMAEVEKKIAEVEEEAEMAETRNYPKVRRAWEEEVGTQVRTQGEETRYLLKESRNQNQ